MTDSVSVWEPRGTVASAEVLIVASDGDITIAELVAGEEPEPRPLLYLERHGLFSLVGIVPWSASDPEGGATRLVLRARACV